MKGYSSGWRSDDKFVVALELGDRKGRDPAHGLQRRIARPLELFGKGQEFRFGRNLVESADAHVDGMDLAAAEQVHDLVPGLLQAQSALDLRGMVLGHADGVLIAEEVGRVQQVNVQRMALDPFAAVQQPPQRPNGPGILTPSASSIA